MTKHAQTAAEQLAQALLLEQVQYFKNNLSIQQSPAYIQQFIQLMFASTRQFSLQDFVELEQLQAVVKRYVFEMQLGAGLLEFIGELSQRIYMTALKSPAHVQDVISDHQFNVWLSKFLELKNVREYQHRILQHSPAIEQLCHHLAVNVLQHKLPHLFKQQPDFNEDAPATTWQAKLKRFSLKQQQNVSQKVEDQLAKFIHQQMSELTLLSNDDLESFIRQFWDDAKHKTMYECIAHFNPLDIEEFFVLVYEYWKELRQSEFIQTLILYGVEIFYRSNQHQSMEELLQSIGLNEDDLVTEYLRFYPKIINTLDQNGLLEPIIYSLLKPFYLRRKTLSLIEQHLPEAADTNSNSNAATTPQQQNQNQSSAKKPLANKAKSKVDDAAPNDH